MLGPVFGVEGIIGAGKTTATEAIAKKLKLRPMYEPVETNPYLEDFYQEPKRWAFPMQMHLLMHRYAMQQAASWESLLGKGCLLDRTLAGDRVFCKLHMVAGNMSEQEWQTYDRAYNIMAASIRVPTLIVFLNVRPKVAMERIRHRARGAETGIQLDYLEQLHRGYMDLIEQIDSGRHAWSQGMQVINIDYDAMGVDQLVEHLGERFGLWGEDETYREAADSQMNLALPFTSS